MYGEYALEPAALFSWEQVRFFLDQVGPWYGRFVAKYPKTWKRLVYEAARRCPPIELKRIEERLATLDERVFANRKGAPYDPSQSWVANALGEHARQPFTAIITHEAANEAVPAVDVHRDHAAWRREHGRFIARASGDFVAALALLLRHSRRVVLIDPYFRADQSEKRDPLLAFCTELSAGATIEIHTSTHHVADHFSIDVARQQLPQRLPAGLSFSLHIWKQRPQGLRLHNRYLITEIGGVQFGDGIELGGPGETDHVNLLDEPSRAELWEQYVDPGVAFDHAAPVLTIVGTRGAGTR
jgi:hypothetical protein